MVVGMLCEVGYPEYTICAQTILSRCVFVVSFNLYLLQEGGVGFSLVHPQLESINVPPNSLAQRFRIWIGMHVGRLYPDSSIGRYDRQ